MQSHPRSPFEMLSSPSHFIETPEGYPNHLIPKVNGNQPVTNSGPELFFNTGYD
jgi:hypothetical protein